MTQFDLAFAGRVYRDTILHPGSPPVRIAGGALTYGAIAAARIGLRVGVFAKMAVADRALLADVERAGVSCSIVPSDVTSEFEVSYPHHGSEHRVIRQPRAAQPFRADEVPEISARVLHLAGNAQGEFPFEFVLAMRREGRLLSLDMQAFVRQPTGKNHVLKSGDVPLKRELAAGVDVLKLDQVEAELLTGERDPGRAAEAVAAWGCREVVLTHGAGIVVRAGGETLRARFTNRGAAGRNGRGATTLAAYLGRRLTHAPAEAVRFAAALASIKLETPGPFAGTCDDVLRRMAKEDGGA